MKYQRVLLLVVLLVAFCSFAFAGELISKEAVNYFNAAVKAQKLSNFLDAETNYQKALILAPNNAEYQKLILNNRGIMFLQMGDLEKADASFRAALQMDPNYQAAQINLGLMNEKLLSRCEALEYWAKLYDWEKTKPRDFVLSECPPVEKIETIPCPVEEKKVEEPKCPF
jgi:tetratricopeptide (TPR) repeat protein